MMRNRTIYSTILLILFSGILAVGQNPYFAIKNVRKGKSFSFPILTAKRNRSVETKINQLLQLSELKALADPKRELVFDQAISDDGSIYGRKVSLSFDLYANSPRILSLGVNNSMDGATTHWWVSYYNFNPQNGDLISLRDLFAERGYRKFVDLSIAKRSKAFRSQVAAKVIPEEQDSFLPVLGSIESDDRSDFSIGSRSITIDGGNLLGKSFCCEGLQMKVRFDLAAFRNWLNASGRFLFGLQKGNLRKYRSRGLPQLFRGTVDAKYPFVAVLKTSGSNDVEGVYAYLKHRKGIYLAGTTTDTDTKLTEYVLVKTKLNIETRSNHRFVENGTISGVWDGISLKGIWTNNKKQRAMTFVATRE